MGLVWLFPISTYWFSQHIHPSWPAALRPRTMPPPSSSSSRDAVHLHHDSPWPRPPARQPSAPLSVMPIAELSFSPGKGWITCHDFSSLIPNKFYEQNVFSCLFLLIWKTLGSIVCMLYICGKGAGCFQCTTKLDWNLENILKLNRSPPPVIVLVLVLRYSNSLSSHNLLTSSSKFMDPGENSSSHKGETACDAESTNQNSKVYHKLYWNANIHQIDQKW